MRTLLTCTAATLVLTGCGFDDPPATEAESVVQTIAPAQADDPCTAVALSLLDGLLLPLPSADPASGEKGGRVAEQFQVRYDEVIAASGVEAARAQYADDIEAACKG
jgi:hypothetical protein